VRSVFGAYDPKAGACGTLYTIPEDIRLNHRVHIVPGVCDTECESILRSFFGRIRTIPSRE
jgi:tRNA(adenine34) deaminase